MATPCNSRLQQAPFNTYRDPQTGEWRLEQQQPAATSNAGKVIPFLRPTETLPTVISQAK